MDNSHLTEEEEFSFKQVIQKWQENILYALTFWRILLVAGLAGAMLGLTYAIVHSVTYTARLSFVVQEAKTGGGSIVSALAGEAGFDLGGLGGSTGMLAGDNVLELLKSRSLIKKTLLTPYYDSSNFSLADAYAEAYDLKEKWKNSSKVGIQINFPSDHLPFTRLQDSLLQTIIEKITEKELSIGKPDKKLSIFELQIESRNERLSQLFCTRLLTITSDFYVQTKTKSLIKNIDRLQRRADSIGGLLNVKTHTAADANLMLLNGNPAYSSAEVSAEISSRDKIIQGTIYSEIVKNLEVSKTALIQETPTIQVVDNPELPLKKNKVSKLIALCAGFVIGIGITGLFLVVKRKN
jgi:hypothetical protein